MKKYCKILLVLLAVLVVSCKQKEADEPEQKHRSLFAQSFITMIQNDESARLLLEKSIAKCKAINPDKQTNPVQSLEEYYDFVEWSVRCMPWNVVTLNNEYSLYTHIDQSLNYFYWLLEQPLEELANEGYYNNTLQYHEPFRTWLIAYTKEWGKYLSTTDSWNDDYLKLAIQNTDFGLSNNWYESSDNWHSFNDFFARKLISQSARPIAEPNDETVLVSPADAVPQGVWEIDENNQIVQKDGVVVKGKRYGSIEEMLGPDCQYSEHFKGGKMTHCFLDVNDYHNYHFPISGHIVQIYKIVQDEAIGGTVVFDAKTKKYVLECGTPDWQSIETRSVVILQTEQWGYVAVMPIGMSQICSCNWDASLNVGKDVTKGDHMGYFMFGGSDIVMVFEPGVQIDLLAPGNGNGGYEHILQGERYARLSK